MDQLVQQIIVGVAVVLAALYVSRKIWLQFIKGDDQPACSKCQPARQAGNPKFQNPNPK